MKLRGLKLIILVCLLLPVMVFYAGETKIQRQKFEVTFTVTYNAITLEDAAQKELEFRERYSDACKVKVSLKEAQQGFLVWGESMVNPTQLVHITPSDSLWVVEE